MFAAAEELGAAVFVHALHPSGKERIVGPPGLMTFIGFPLETAYTIASLITGGTLTRHPRLRLAFSHGGGAFASILPRLAHGWKIKPEFAERMGAAPHEHARRLYYDTLVYDAPTLQAPDRHFRRAPALRRHRFPVRGLRARADRRRRRA